MSKIPYNLILNNHNKWIPKAAYIRNTPELREFIKSNLRITFDNPDEEGEWLLVAINASYIGNLYTTAWVESDESFKKYGENNPYCKVFDYNEEAFKKYLNWAMNIPRRIVNGKFEK